MYLPFVLKFEIPRDNLYFPKLKGALKNQGSMELKSLVEIPDILLSCLSSLCLSFLIQKI